MLISVILVSFNTAEMTVKALDNLFASECELNMEVFVVDNASKDSSVAYIKRFYPNITLIENTKNVGFGRANNQVLNLIRGDYVLLLNTDAFVGKDTLDKTSQYMQANPDCGVLGVKLLGSKGELQPSCRYFPTPFNLLANREGLHRFFPNIKLIDDIDWNSDITQGCDWVPGCYYLIKKEVIDQVGLFDPAYFLYYEEVDHCYAVKKAGWKVIYFSETSVLHIGGESAKLVGKVTSSGRQLNKLLVESELIYFRKNHGAFTCLLQIVLILFSDIIHTFKNFFKLRMSNLFTFSDTKLYVVTAWNTRLGLVPTK